MKLFVSDYDDTFYINEEGIKKNIEMVKKWKEKGNLFAFATGRDYADFKKAKEKYSLIYDYVILNHGTTILDSNDQILYNEIINEECIHSLKEKLEEDSFEIYTASSLESKKDLNYPDITKITVTYIFPEDAARMDEELRDAYYEYLHIYLVSPCRIEMIPRGVNKRTGVDYLIKKCNIDENDVYCIGDGHSDVPMVRKYHGGCMVNSIPSLSDYAENRYESVADYLEEILDKS